MRVKPQERAIFLDRDGTLNHDSGYTHKISQWRWLPGAIAGLGLFMRSGYRLIVASNQSGIGRGYYTLEDVKKLEKWLDEELGKEDIEIAAWRYCPHLPDAGCGCRKPAPGLILDAARDFDINLPSSWMLGDRLGDIQAGLAAGCKAGLIGQTASLQEKAQARAIYPQVPIWPTLLEAAQAILEEDYPQAGSLACQPRNIP